MGYVVDWVVDQVVGIVVVGNIAVAVVKNTVGVVIWVSLTDVTVVDTFVVVVVTGAVAVVVWDMVWLLQMSFWWHGCECRWLCFMTRYSLPVLSRMCVFWSVKL